MSGKKKNISKLLHQIRDSLSLVGPMTQKELFKHLSSTGYGRRVVTRTLQFMVNNKNGGVFVDGVRASVSLKKYPKFDLYSLN